MKATCAGNLVSTHHKLDSVPYCIHASATGAQATRIACMHGVSGYMHTSVYTSHASKEMMCGTGAMNM